MDRLFRESPLIVPFNNYKFEERRDPEAGLDNPSTPIDEKNEFKGELAHEEDSHINRLH